MPLSASTSDGSIPPMPMTAIRQPLPASRDILHARALEQAVADIRSGDDPRRVHVDRDGAEHPREFGEQPMRVALNLGDADAAEQLHDLGRAG